MTQPVVRRSLVDIIQDEDIRMPTVELFLYPLIASCMSQFTNVFCTSDLGTEEYNFDWLHIPQCREGLNPCICTVLHPPLVVSCCRLSVRIQLFDISFGDHLGFVFIKSKVQAYIFREDLDNS